MSSIIQFKRGSAPPPELLPGEPGWCMDTGELYIGTLSGNVLIGNSGTCPNYDEAIALIEGRLDVLEDGASPFALSATVEDLANDIYVLAHTYGGSFSFLVSNSYIEIAATLEEITVGGKILVPGDTVLVSTPLAIPHQNKYSGLWEYKGKIGANHEFRRDAPWFELETDIPSGLLVIVRDGDYRGRISVITSTVDPFVLGTNDVFVNSIVKSITGGNIYIQSTPPTAPQENDVWFDLSLVME